MRRVEEKIITDYGFNHLKSQIVTSNDNLNLKSQFATLEKWDSLRSQNATIVGRRGHHRKYLPYAFSEQEGYTIPMHTCKGVHKKAIELCIGAEGMHRSCACFTGGAQNNSPEFDGFRKEAGLNSFTLMPKQWIEKTNAIGIISKAGRYGGTYDIAKCDTFKAVFAQQVVSQLIQIPCGQNITKNLPDEFRSSLPSIEEIKTELSGWEK